MKRRAADMAALLIRLHCPRLRRILEDVRTEHAETRMKTDNVLEGGCACGAIRYQVTVVPTDAGFCHCRLCQKTTGAAVTASASVPIGEFRYVRGEPRVYESSTWGERRFCGHCGTQLEYRESAAPQTVEINYATLDDPTRVRPSWHVWCASMFPGLSLSDDLPKYQDGA
jgi:hypothetical protein